jgi:hypothetical protein
MHRDDFESFMLEARLGMVRDVLSSSQQHAGDPVLREVAPLAMTVAYLLKMLGIYEDAVKDLFTQVEDLKLRQIEQSLGSVDSGLDTDPDGDSC